MSEETAGARHKYNSQYFGGGIKGMMRGMRGMMGGRGGMPFR